LLAFQVKLFTKQQEAM